MQKKGSGVVLGRELDALVEVFRLLSDRTRLNVLLLLARGERNVTDLCEELDLPQPTVSHHLGLLRMRNLISNRRDGKQVFYGLNGQVVPGADNSLRIGAQQFSIRIEAKGKK